MTIPTALPVDLSDYNFCVRINLVNEKVLTYDSVESIPSIVGGYVVFDRGDSSMVSISVDKVDTVDIHAVLNVRQYVDVVESLTPVLFGSPSPSAYRKGGRHHV